MIAIDGAAVRLPHEETADFVVVGTGPAGAAAARTLARAGASVVAVEEGRLVPAAALGRDSFSAMRELYRDLGATLVHGRAPFPYVQGRAVGGTSVINGGISWRLPRDVHEAWLAADPALEAALPWERVEAAHEEVERDLGVAPTEPSIAGRKNELFARGAEAIGLEHRPIARNVRGCEGLGRCLEGCPRGRKASMDRTFLLEAVAAGARLVASVRADRIELKACPAIGPPASGGLTAGPRFARRRRASCWLRPSGFAAGRATTVIGTSAGGARVRLRARRGVVLAASAVGSPALLLRSGLRNGPVGEHFQCHPGASVAGRFREPVRLWEGATQGHEGTGLRREGLKFEVLGYDLGLAASRAPGVGRAHAAALEELDHHAHFGVALRAEACGRVSLGLAGRPRVRLTLTLSDVRRLRRGIRVLGELLLAAGAERVFPGVHGFAPEIGDPSELARLEAEGPDDPRAYAVAATHLFGSCRMASRPSHGVVRPDFRLHAVEGLWVVDSSVFPGNTGVNPQTSILALATLAARGIAASPPA